MKYALALACLFATPLSAQGIGGLNFSGDFGVGVKVSPEYPGSDDYKLGPWGIIRNAGFGERGVARDGFSFSPSFALIGSREADDALELAGFEDIDPALELGGRATYRYGALAVSAALRKGFGGHDGLAGDVTARVRTPLSDSVTLWTGVSAFYADDEKMNTYFGVTDEQAAGTGLDAYTPEGGFNEVAMSVEGRYQMTEKTALIGEVGYGKLIGDAADSPLVVEEGQPIARIGVVRNFSFGF